MTDATKKRRNLNPLPVDIDVAGWKIAADYLEESRPFFIDEDVETLCNMHDSNVPAQRGYYYFPAAAVCTLTRFPADGIEAFQDILPHIFVLVPQFNRPIAEAKLTPLFSARSVIDLLSFYNMARLGKTGKPLYYNRIFRVRRNLLRY